MKKFPNSLALLVTAIIAVLPSCAQTTGKPPVLNQHILAAVKSMPKGGGYDASQKAVDRLAASVSYKDGRIHQDSKTATASFCSGATYLVLLKAIEQLRNQNALELSPKNLARFANLGVKDGEEIFGRWNANGPGAAKLFADLGCGVNFTSYDHAQPGDFLKMWWTEAIGGKEKGHLVVYLGHTEKNVRFWSSNQPGGYGEKTVSRDKIKNALFTRLTNHTRLTMGTKLSPSDPFLADMLRKDFSWAKVIQTCKVRKSP